ncbi:hypothetical protein [Xenorhabdus bovienii]|uniref:hypothetical protein n=1 Tax=Xenorhabdus bovienii TaxID=40576 RepID=UPI003DA63D1F
MAQKLRPFAFNYPYCFYFLAYLLVAKYFHQNDKVQIKERSMKNKLLNPENVIFPAESREIELVETIMLVEVGHTQFELVEEEIYRKADGKLIDTRIALTRKEWKYGRRVTAITKHYPMSERDKAISEMVTLTQWTIMETAQDKMAK